ncbi:Crp/Fnr family transcriptional regulator, partial [candidate division CSSED10-310 bacterium]
VFEKVERIDVVRMAKITCPFDLGEMKLLESGKQVCSLVEKGFETKMAGITIAANVANTILFKNLSEGDLYHLGRISRIKKFPAGTPLAKEGDEANSIFLIVSGEVEVRKQEKVISVQKDGFLIGEMSLVDDAPRSADLIVTQNSTIIDVNIKQLKRLMDIRPRLGSVVSMNLAKSLSSKLRMTSKI